MDNLTHSLTGLALGALTERSLAPEPTPERARVRQRLLLATAAIASNLPDLDLVLTPLAARPLGYLLHHRGHTHTLLAALPQLLALLGLVWLLWPAARALLGASRAARGAVAAVGAAGLALHLGMDWLNVYGVHPFAPFDNRWWYGDLVFIVEPVFWIACGAPLAAMAPGRALRAVLLGAMALALTACAAAGLLPWPSLAALLALGAALVRLHIASPARSRRALLAGLMCAAGFVGVQALAAQQARAVLARAIAARAGHGVLLDLPLSAYPANPLCWNAVSVELDAPGGRYWLRRVTLSLAPQWLPVAACPARLGGAGAGDGAIAWQWEQAYPLASLHARRAADCRVDAWLRFARAPALDATAATDVRWSVPPATNFSTLPLAASAPADCGALPGWGQPRADLLAAPRR